MRYNRFFYVLSAVAAMFSAISCEDKGDGPSVTKVELTAEMQQIPEGVASFDAEAGIITVNSEGVMTSTMTFSDAKGADMSDYKLKTDVPSADKLWCVASCSKRRLSLSVAKNTSENPRQTDIEITAYYEDQAAGSYTLTVVQSGVKKDEPDVPAPSASAEITQFIIPGQISSTITYPTITVVMPQGTDVTALKPVVVVSEGSVVTPGSGEAQNFTEAVQYQVVNEKAKESKTYFAVVTVQSGGGGTTDPGTGIETNPNFKMFDMVTVGAGSFIMGKDPSGQHSDQTNSHKVNISAFEMGRYEVTQREFQQVLGYNPSVKQDSDLYPVHKVTLYEAMNYCNALSKEKGYTPVYTFSDEKWDATGKELLEAVVARNKNANGYRLPTNAEYEYAMKGGPDNANYPYFYSGSNDINDVCWFEDNAIKVVGGEPVVHAVGTKKPNSLGIYDLSGNIEEYTGEWYLQLDYVSDAEETDPWGPEKPRSMDEQYVISRGGCFDTYAWNCGVTGWRILGAHIKTDKNFPGGDIWFGQIGFRVVRSLK